MKLRRALNRIQDFANEPDGYHPCVPCVPVRAAQPLSHRRVICYLSRSIMRRLVASFVLSVVAWGCLGPLALPATGNSTPACCRRNAKHHCAGDIPAWLASNDGTPSFRANPPDCPFRSQIVAPTSLAQPQHQAASTLLLPSASFISMADFPFLSTCYAASDRQRGPPASSL